MPTEEEFYEIRYNINRKRSGGNNLTDHDVREVIKNYFYNVGKPHPAPSSELLDALKRESWDLRCFNIPTGGDDFDIGWRVVGHWQAEPCERVIAEVYEDDPAAAVRAAIAKHKGPQS